MGLNLICYYFSYFRILIFEKKFIVFGVHKGKGKGPTQRLDDATITAEAKYSIDFTASKKICLSLCCNESGSFCMLIQNLKEKIQKHNNSYCVYVKFQKILQLII